MKTLNIRLVGISLACLLALGALVHWLHGFQVKRNAHVFLQEAERAKEAGRLGEAVRHLDWYVRLAPDDVDAVAELGLLLADVSADFRAYAMLERALRLGAHREDLRRKLVDVAINLGRYSDARRHLEEHLLGPQLSDQTRLRQLGASLERHATLLEDQRRIEREIAEPEEQVAGLGEQGHRLPQESVESLERVRGALREVAQTLAQEAKLILRPSEQPEESPTRSGELLEQLGRCQLEADETGAAAISLCLSVFAAPNRLEAYLRLADLFEKRLERPAAADYWIERMAENNPDSCPAQVYLGRHLVDRGGLDEADEAAATSLMLAPDDVDALLLAAEVASAKAVQAAEPDEKAELFEQARKHAADAARHHPQNASVYAALASIEVQAGRPHEAIARLQQGLDKIAGQAELLWTLGFLLVETGDSSQARNCAQQLAEAGYPEPLVRFLKARVEMSEGQLLAASQGLERIRAELNSWPDLLKQADFYLGQCYEQLGNADQQLAAYRRAVAVDPFWVPARAGVAAALFSLGRIEEALEEYRHLVRLKGASPDGMIRLASLMILRNLRLDQSDRDWDETEKLLDRLAQAAPETAGVPILFAEVRLAQGRGDEARQLLEKARAENSEGIELRLALAALAQRERNWKRAEQLLEEAKRDLGDSVILRLARARYLVSRVRDEPAKRDDFLGSMHALAEQPETLSEGDLSKLWSGLTVSAMQVGDYDHARRCCRRLSEANPNDLRAWLLRFDLALGMADGARRAADDSGRARMLAEMEDVLEEMEQTLEEIQRIEGRGPLWQYGRALYLSLQTTQDEKQRLEEALELLTNAAMARPAWSRLALLAARIHDRLGNEELALEQYVRAIELGDRSPNAVRRAIQLLADRQRYLEADRLIRRLEQQQMPFSLDLAKMATEVSLRLDDFERALERAQQTAVASEDYRDHAWLGEVFSVLGQRAKREGRAEQAQRMLQRAEGELRRAVELSPQAVGAWVALVRFYARTDRPAAAEEVLEEADQKIPEGMAPVAVAQCYEVIGKVNEAEQKYRQALDDKPDDPAVTRQVTEFYLRSGKPEAAEVQLKRLVEGDVDAEEGDLAWARRQWALIFAGRVGPKNLNRGLSLLSRNSEGTIPTVQDRRARALLLASHAEREKRQEAVKILEEILRDPQVSGPDDRFILARLYLAAGDWASVTKHMRILLASNGQEPRYVASYIGMLLEHGEVREAELRLRHLDKIAPDQVATAQLRAKVLVERGQYDKAIAVLMGFLNGPDVDERSDRPARYSAVAATLADFAQQLNKPAQREAASRFAREAEAVYRDCADMHPETGVLLAAFLARRNRLQEALDVYEKVWQDSRPAMIAATMTVVLREANAEAELLRRAEAVLQAALRKHQRPLSMLAILADLCTALGRYDEAEAIYREILNRNRSVVALNNLAVLLAIQGNNHQEAEELIQEAINAIGRTPELLDSRATVYLARGKLENALADVSQAIAEKPSPVYYFHEAQVLHRMRRTGAAQAALAKAHQLGLTAEVLHPLERTAYKKLKLTIGEANVPLRARGQ